MFSAHPSAQESLQTPALSSGQDCSVCPLVTGVLTQPVQPEKMMTEWMHHSQAEQLPE